MNAKNALGVFGGLFSKIIGFAIPKLEGVANEAVEWVRSEAGVPALKKATEDFVVALLAAYEAFKEEAKKLFAFMGELAFPGDHGGWKAAEFFTTTNKKTKFRHVDLGLITFLGNEEIEFSPARKLATQKLQQNAKDGEILPQLGEVPDLTTGELRWLCEGGILELERWYAGYLKNRCGERLAVYFYLTRGGWSVFCFSVSDGGGWDEGDIFVSPQSLVRPRVIRPLSP